MIKNLAVVTIVINQLESSKRFYGDALGYKLLEEGTLSEKQKEAYGQHLSGYLLYGHEEGSVIRLLLSDDPTMLPNRMGANPWDLGLAVFEGGCPDIEAVYHRILKNRFGVISEPLEFDSEGPEPLGYLVMKSIGVMGPNGEQMFITEIVKRHGGKSLLKEKAVAGVNVPGNAVISMKDRAPLEQFWRPLLGIEPVIDLPLQQKNAAVIMGGPPDMGFDMVLTGCGGERIGLEWHFYEKYNPDYTYRVFPCRFDKTGLVAAGYPCSNLDEVKTMITEKGLDIFSEIPLPLKSGENHRSIMIRGPLGELIELIESK
jgi:catechol 2,3-dioxygenase-like lactoylglutathione lyase family enzyme